MIFTLCLPLQASTRELFLSSNSNNAILRNNNDYGFDVSFAAQKLELKEIQTKSGSFDEISIPGFSHSNTVGEPKLPMLRKLIYAPLGAEVRYSINSQDRGQYSPEKSNLVNRIIPAQEPVSKSADPEQLPFAYHQAAYSRNAFTNREPVEIHELGIMRGVRLLALDFYPVSYNPVTGELQIVKNLDVKVDFINPDLYATRELLAKTASYEYDQLYAKSIFNWDNDSRISLVRYPTKMVILTPTAYVSTMQTFIDWKIQQGYNVIVRTIGSDGQTANTQAAITSYISGLWSAATANDPAPTYMLIVGDTGTSNGTVIAPTGATASHPTDLTYVRLEGTDYMPEMYYGRFSVTSTTELDRVISKTLMFEKTLQPDLSYLGQVVMIAGVDGSFGPTHGNGAINYGTTEYFNAAHGITSNTYLYPASGSSDAQIIANANEGRGYMNYTAHGSTTSWADPTMTVTDLTNMTNVNKPFVAVGNCCVTNQFTTANCFGEAVIRSQNAGVAYIGGTNNTYWDEDYWWAVGAKGTATGSAPAYDATKLGAYDAMFHTHSEAVTDWAQTTGETVVMGNLAVAQGNSSRTNYYWEIYSIMGDPSLKPYFGVPTANTATFPASIMIGNTSINVTAAPQSRVALSKDGVLYGVGIVGTSGSLSLPITPFTSPGTATLVITRSQKITRIESIAVIAASGPYLTLDSATYADSNNNNPEANETGRFNVTINNVGVAAATAVTATLTCSTNGITITDGTEYFASIAAGSSASANNAFAFNIANGVANGTIASFTLTMVSGSDTWTSNFFITISAPVLAFGNITVQDPTGNNNGRLDPGETATIIIPLANSGGAASVSGSATLSSSTPGITIISGSQNFSAISAGGSTNLSFSLSVNSSVSVGSIANLLFGATAGAYTASKNEAVSIGLILEDFETGNFTSFPWTFSGNLPWTVVNSGAYAGTYAAKSGTITHSQTSTMQTTRILSSPGTISFWYKVSSESGYDYLRFYVDGVQQSQWSGTVDWAQASYELAAGTRVLAWTYYKDVSVSTNSDCAWIDNIIFPASVSSVVLNPPQNLSAIASHQSVSLSWQAPVSGTPQQYKLYRNSTLLATQTGLTYTDTAVTNGTTYTYYVVANYSGGDSEPSNSVNATPNASAPTNLTAAAGNGFVQLTWNASAGRSDDQRFTSGYKVYRNGSALTTVTETNYTDNSVTNEVTYSYYVTTLYASPTGESSPSNTVNATPTAVVPTEAVLGNGTEATGTSTASPINIWYKSLHGQSVYTAAELNAAGIFGPIQINQIGFDVVTAPVEALPSFIVRMKHTADSNVANWQTINNMETVYSSVLYAPTAGGFDMLTLSSPYLWDGTNNLVIDTAFDMVSAYNTSGTVRYTTVTSGYRFARSDGSNQTDIFSGSDTITNRPNVKMVFQPLTSGPLLSVNPTSLSYGEIPVNTTSTKQLLLRNNGDETLTGTITTPAGYQIALSAARNGEDRNTLNISLEPSQERTYNVTFVPTAVQAYNGNITINSNCALNPVYNIPVTGSAYVPPAIGLSTTSVRVELESGQETTELLTISNTGSRALTYTISFEDPSARNTASSQISKTKSDDRSIAGSTFSIDPQAYTPGDQNTWTLTVFNASTDTEWLKDIWLRLPDEFSVVSVSDFTGGTAPMTPTVNGTEINWHGETSNGYGFIQGNQTGTATIVVAVASSVRGPQDIGYQLDGDIWGAEPHTLQDTITLTQNTPAIEWLSGSPLSGTIAGGSSQDISLALSAINMDLGEYTAVMKVTSNDPITPVSSVEIMMIVTTDPNYPPVISDWPGSFSMDKNESLSFSMNQYASDPNPDDVLSLNVTGNTNLIVDVQGMHVNISTLPNWIGNELLTFAVTDGVNTVYADALVTVNPINVPTWTPVEYPTNPATIYAEVRLDDIPAKANDYVGAFVDGECRGTAEVIWTRESAHATIIVSLANPNEQINFKVYSYENDMIYESLTIVTANFGDEIGVTEPVLIAAESIITLDRPVPRMQSSATGLKIIWNSVLHATTYEIYASSSPGGPFNLVGTTTDPEWSISSPLDKMFYYIKAKRSGVTQ